MKLVLNEDKDICRVKLVPQCECGYIFDKLEYHKYTENTKSEYLIAQFGFEPKTCPKCGRLIIRVETPIINENEGCCNFII